MRSPANIIALLIFVLISLLGIIYVARRTAYFFGLSPVVAYTLFFAILVVAVAITGSNIYVTGLSRMSHLLVLFSCYTLGTLLTLLMVALLEHLVTLPFTVANPLWEGVGVYVATAVLVVVQSVIPWQTKVVAVDVPMPGLERRLNIVQLSDLHIGHMRGRDWLSDVVDQTNQLHPDMVVITGDIAESQYNLTSEVYQELGRIDAPVYYVSGNHDAYANLLRVKNLMGEAGVRVLDDTKIDTLGLQLIGVSHSSVADNVLNALLIDKSRPAIMLYHYPKGVETAYARGVGLVLAGHTHGGQFFPITLINHFGFKYNRGLNRYPERQNENYYTYIYTSDGLGTTGPPMRLGTRSEITLIHLNP